MTQRAWKRLTALSQLLLRIEDESPYPKKAGNTNGNEEERIDAAIAKTRTFFESLGLPTTLSAYGLGQQDIDAIVGQLAAHGMTALGEKNDLTPEISRRILEASL